VSFKSIFHISSFNVHSARLSGLPQIQLGAFLLRQNEFVQRVSNLRNLSLNNNGIARASVSVAALSLTSIRERMLLIKSFQLAAAAATSVADIESILSFYPSANKIKNNCELFLFSFDFLFQQSFRVSSAGCACFVCAWKSYSFLLSSFETKQQKKRLRGGNFSYISGIRSCQSKIGKKVER